MGYTFIRGRGLLSQIRPLPPEGPLEGFLTRRMLAAVRFPTVLLFALTWVACPRSYGDVGVVLNESMDSSVDKITGTGHSAVYFSRICADTPVKLRLCRPEENGSVMSNYINIGEDQDPEWNVVPLNIYLYGVEDERNRPVFGSFKIKRVLEERYRTKYLEPYCQGLPCKTSYKSEWREMVGATFVRSLHIFVVDTTLEQDLKLIAEFNALPNKNHFNGFTRNCADFTSHVINSYFPNATHRDYLNDFGMTSPKAVARTFARYAERHPEVHFRVLHFAQLPGPIKRSRECRAGTEQLYRSKKLLVPMLVLGSHELPVVAASYLLTGRFNAEHVFEEHPTAKATEIDYRMQRAKAEKNKLETEELETARNEERARIVGTAAEWKEYRDALDSITHEAVGEESVPGRAHMRHIFQHLDKAGTPTVDTSGAIWMEFSEGGEAHKVGLSASNVVASDSDPRAAYELILERTERALKSPKHGRETMVELRQDWVLLQALRTKNTASLASTSANAARVMMAD